MPSSTSSSNDRLPESHPAWLATAVLIFCCLLGAYELALRKYGLRPSANDDARLWSLVRHEVEPHSNSEVVLIGASRIQADIEGDVFAQELGSEKPKQLGIAGSSPIPVLQELAADETFHGLVICDVMPIYFFTGLEHPQGRAPEYLIQSRRDWPWDIASTRLRALLEARAAFRAPDAAPSAAKLLDLVAMRLKLRQHTLVDADRYTRIYRSAKDVQPQQILELAKLTEATQPVSFQQMDRDFAQISGWVKQIRARGGDVLFVVLPVTGLRWEAEDRRFPRAKYWDRFAAAVEADKIHYQDFQALASYECFDGSHLNANDSVAFSRDFAQIVSERLEPRETASRLARARRQFTMAGEAAQP